MHNTDYHEGIRLLDARVSKDFLFMRFLGVNFSKWSGIQANAVARIFSPVVSFKP